MKARTDLTHASRRRRGRRRRRPILAVVYMALLASGCSDEVTGLVRPPQFEPPEESVTGSFAGAAAKVMFKGVATGVAHGAGEELFGWTMGALGLAEGAPDYTEQLDRIDDDLKVMIDELNGIQDELNSIQGELTVLNCTNWATALTTEKARVDNLLSDYQSFASTAASGGTVSGSTLSDWVDQVEAHGSYESHESMGDIIATFISTLMGPGNTGVIPACVQSISVPASQAVSVDDEYYEQVQLFTDYYYNYQVRALFLYVEAKHYRAWVAAGSPTSSTLSADSIAAVCSNASAALYCNQAAQRTNEVYNALVAQATASGAPYTNDDVVLVYGANFAYVMPLSLEDFNDASPFPISSKPLTSAKPGGAVVGQYNVASPSFTNVVFHGYTNWDIADLVTWNTLLSGWTSGTAGQFLETAYGFQYMKDKIILSKTAVTIRLTNSGVDQTVVAFVDTDMDHSWVQSPFNTSAEFDKLVQRTSIAGYLCTGAFGVGQTSTTYFKGSALTPDSTYKYPANRSGFYDFAARVQTCVSGPTPTYMSPFSYTAYNEWPGWVIELDGVANE